MTEPPLAEAYADADETLSAEPGTLGNNRWSAVEGTGIPVDFPASIVSIVRSSFSSACFSFR